MRFLAEAVPGTHQLVPVCGDQSLNLLILRFYYCSISADSLASSALAILITLLLVLLTARSVSRTRPGKLQMVFEFLLDYIKGLVRESVTEEGADFIIPIAATIALYILVANWLDFLPLPKPLYPANSDLNQTLAMAVVVIVVVQWYAFREQGAAGYFRRFTKPFEMPIAVRILFIPLNVIEEVVKPVTLALRLFGNIFAGLLMIYILTLLPFTISWAPVVVWKFFDVFFVGTIQAFIFMLLTIIYFGQAREGLEEEHHGAPGAAPSAGHAQGAATTAIPNS